MLLYGHGHHEKDARRDTNSTPTVCCCELRTHSAPKTRIARAPELVAVNPVANRTSLLVRRYEFESSIKSVGFSCIRAAKQLCCPHHTSSALT
jgi:hypothetical protein